MPRVLLAGLFHETHTFLSGVTGLAEFQRREGDELRTAEGDGSPLAAMLEVGRECGWEIVPVIDLRATPGPTVAPPAAATAAPEAGCRRAAPAGTGRPAPACRIPHPDGCSPS